MILRRMLPRKNPELKKMGNSGSKITRQKKRELAEDKAENMAQPRLA